MLKIKVGGTGHVESADEVMARQVKEACERFDSVEVPTKGRMMYDPEKGELLGPVDVDIKKTDDPKVTLCMIVRDEEEHIGRCLASVKGHVDEIVIVDTGSKDKTVEIAKSYGATVYEHPELYIGWNADKTEYLGSFSAARMKAMSYVTTEWILQLDGDEEMEPESAGKIRDVVRDVHTSTANLCSLVLYNRKIGSTEDLTIIKTGKLIRMGIGAHYVNRIHNKLVVEGDTRETGLKIYHYGYHLSDEVMKAKQERTTQLLLQQHKEMPDDPETYYYLIIQYLRAEEWDTCIEHVMIAEKLFLEKDPESQLLLLVYNMGGIAYYHKKVANMDEKQDYLKAAEDFCLKALAIYPDYLDANSLISSIYFATKNYEKCYTYSAKFLAVAEMIKADPTKTLIIPLNCMKNEWVINIHLCINFYEQADQEKAVLFLKRSEDCMPVDEKYKPSFTMFKYMFKRGDPASLSNAEAIYKTGYRSGEGE